MSDTARVEEDFRQDARATMLASAIREYLVEHEHDSRDGVAEDWEIRHGIRAGMKTLGFRFEIERL